MITPGDLGVATVATGLFTGVFSVWWKGRKDGQVNALNLQVTKDVATEAARAELERLKLAETSDILKGSGELRKDVIAELDRRDEEHKREMARLAGETKELKAETEGLRQRRDAELAEMKRHIQDGAEERAMLVGNLARVEGEHRSEAARYLAVIGEKNAEIVRQAKVIEEQNRKIAELSRRVSELEKGNGNGSKHT